jgi:peptidoglycan/LPS O-acetylase OafA/YrhL
MVRVALALAVLLSHLPMASYKFLSGGLAVQAFFIVSGFYMALVLDGKYRDVGLFYSNRLLRLFPTYFTICILGAIALWGFNASPTASPEIFANIFENPLTTAVMVVENIVMVGQEMLFWFTIDDAGALVWNANGAVPDETIIMGWQGLLIPQSWSLSMELMFYAIAPWLARAGWKWIAAIAALSIAIRLAGSQIEGVDYLLWQGRLFPTALFLFLFGMLAHKMLPLAARLPKATGWVLALVVLAWIVGYTQLGLEPMLGRWITYGVIALTTPFIFAAFKDNALDRWVGDLSYPIYLVQLLTIGFVFAYEPPYALWVAIVSTIVLSALVLVAIEHPIDRWRQSRTARARKATAPVAAPA